MRSMPSALHSVGHPVLKEIIFKVLRRRGGCCAPRHSAGPPKAMGVVPGRTATTGCTSTLCELLKQSSSVRS